MGEMTSEGANPGAGIDLSQFYQVFFEEAAENLHRMEAQLLEIDLERADEETLNSIFRCAHSVKGGAATFGFADMAELTHQMETLLDQLRRHELLPTAAMVDVLLQATDSLRAQLACHQGARCDAVDTTALLIDIRALLAEPAHRLGARKNPATSSAATAAKGASPCGTLRELELRVGPLQDPALADSLVDLFRENSDLGTIEPIDGGKASDGVRRFRVVTTNADEDLLDLFSFHVARDEVTLLPCNDGYGFHPGAAGSPPDDPATPTSGYGFFDNAPGAPGAAATVAGPLPLPKTTATQAAAARSASAGARPGRALAATPESSTLRVSVEKVDQLLNLVGELVITQAMLAQSSQHIDAALYQKFVAGLADLDRNTRDLQESVMSIRMTPMSVVFSRFPRMLRDLAAKLGKTVEFVTQGEATELDKGLVEMITDPLTHLVRNSCDHGIETAAERRAAGKREHGTITLTASHQGGSIVIEVRDDGRGLSRQRLIDKARERGIDAPDSMTDTEAYNLIFSPGFSTVDIVTDVSGRGVGMDVVKRNITALGGTVEIDSAEGFGMSVKVRLPLTLAIMDGMPVGVGNEVYILPLSAVIESFQARPEHVRTICGSSRVVEVREEFMPVLDLQQVFDVPRTDSHKAVGIMVVAEADGARVALLVDELLGQQQVVVKNLEANYRRVHDISGATIMGDGRVALILDVGSLVRRSRH